MTDLKARFRKFWSNARFRIVFWATLTGVLCGVSGVGLPVEDVIGSIRDYLRRHPSNGEIALVLQDSRTLDELGAIDVTRAEDAKVTAALFAAGAKRVFFDRGLRYDDSDNGNKQFVDVLKKHPGQVFLSAMPSSDGAGGNHASVLPSVTFRENAKVVSALALHHPFNLNVSWPYSSNSAIGVIPSLPAAIAGVEQGPDLLFQPDYSIDYRTIPTSSYIDVLRGDFEKSNVAGKDVIIAPGSIAYNDIHPLPGGQGYAPGGYFHAIAAETLKRGLPMDVGWIPPFLLVCAIVISGFGRGRVFDVYRFSGLALVLIAAPFVLNYVNIKVDIFPALAVAAVAVFRMRNLDRVEVAGETNAGSGLPSVQALRNFDAMSTKILVALKIRNYGAIIGSFAEHVEAQVAHEIVRRIRISDHDVTVYHESGMFLWLSNIRSTFDLFENLEGLHRIVQNGIQVSGMDIDLSFNCGIDSEFDRTVSSRVASAMQSAEEAVRNDELVYQHDSRRHEAQWELSLLTQLDRAIDNGEVWVAYQPKLDVKSNRIAGAEALVRWTHPERGPISPDKFIRIAEEFHRIERITRFVVNEAVRSAVNLARLGYDFSMSVNISAQLLRNPGLPGMISEILAAHGLPPEKLVLEITETDRLDRSSRTFQMLQRLVQSGLRLSIDDFGTGNATIDYLRYLPAAEVKIDKVFIQAMEANKEDYLLVQSIIEMAHSLDRIVVAEGVETGTALEILKGMGCDTIQGYYVSRPVPFPDLIDNIERKQARMNG
ncbi:MULTISPECIES: EAL domain-containing protein [Novosphingobium]|uniref:Diguanylate phosphodiesterase n=1 Tax=Novosphingobium pentaromativorans US6-1 TaxID=1088721 RepID=G6E7P0_9SPHN|nr:MULTISPECIES: EAL domain-containing protein [Novosphingobium]AIT81732.1 diguanylate phosphodiesterase [Novosphingobium pentaromativorans US6-1]EHJ62682.1 diguanylate phosphodiesterase [Novosphingobium pentaromativorans US6-1]CCA93035.1 diguanylate phosphodiesterase [Novosphingobium sp. PP1Y]